MVLKVPSTVLEKRRGVCVRVEKSEHERTGSERTTIQPLSKGNLLHAETMSVCVSSDRDCMCVCQAALDKRACMCVCQSTHAYVCVKRQACNIC